MKLVISLLLLLSSSILIAGPWIPVGDQWLRSEIEFLSNRGVIKAPITTWPIMWTNIRQDMEQALIPKNFKKLSKREQSTLLRIKAEFNKHTSNTKSYGVEISSSTRVFRDFIDSPREEFSLFYQQQYMTDHFAYNLDVTYSNDPFVALNQKEQALRYDGSYIAGVFGNISYGYGWIDKWWGPGWNSSLILSNNARPRPSLFLKRNSSDMFESDWLRWIGPWTIEGFVSLLNDERFVSNAKLLGMSIAFKPTHNIEVGLRRTAQWGGDGRPQDISTLVDLFLGRDNCGSSGISDCGVENSNEPGNQLAGLDVKWNIPSIESSVYMQMMGEDEADYFPSRRTYLLGASGTYNLNDDLLTYIIEASDTTTNFGDRYDYTYNHFLYRTGYRYFNRSIGSTLDNDGKYYTLKLIYSSEEYKLSMSYTSFDVNVDDSGQNNSISNNSLTTDALEFNFAHNTAIGDFDYTIILNDSGYDSKFGQNSNFMAQLRWTNTF